jgi:hypothetical protein
MREKQFTTKPMPIKVRLWTLVDRDSNFRAKEPDTHIVEISVGNTIIREISTEQASTAQAQYMRIKELLTREHKATKPR